MKCFLLMNCNVQSDSMCVKVLNHFNYVIFACFLLFSTPFLTLSYLTYFYFFALYFMLMQKFLSSLLSLIMTEVRSKCHTLLPLVFKEPLLIKTKTNQKIMRVHTCHICRAWYNSSQTTMAYMMAKSVKTLE